ncbi:MAG: Lrp/AsnC family transcriptional regulator [Desulfovibrio sp.]|nr:Lrp/AsnC family transcriptional regulator [Desulfovibrio sp.]
MHDFTPTERRILHIVQQNIPATLTPYADIAALCGTSEDAVIALIARLQNERAIRRYGAMIRHTKTDWVHNAMVAWNVCEHDRDAFGQYAATYPTISHVYYRPSPSAEWPYTLYTMVHGRSPAEWQETVATVAKAWPDIPYQVLRSIREVKKISMRYF